MKSQDITVEVNLDVTPALEALAKVKAELEAILVLKEKVNGAGQ